MIIRIQEVCIHLFLTNSFGQLLNISSKKLVFLKTFNSEFSHIKAWFTDQSFNQIELKDKINITLIIK